ncbi:LacI family DNA-binding transcriptional regulator [Microbacterium sp. SS28]|uniref:LacI family DNA-binding transcriptional regulator n=1 Tax=Microbacterium sp. SS28 TaxID=2919948 RepID=UPI001FAABCC9|nr:LacI family DNA-binding transcriptional regulator [Microbacterium sp. SS28]
MPERRATLKDVARASGVSTATVSFVLNETPGQTLPPATQERVRAAAAALGYQPHGLARALREGKSRIVLLAIGGLRGGRSLEGFIQGISGELHAHGYGLLVYPGAASDPGHADLVRDLRPHAVIDLARIYTTGGDIDDGGWVDGVAAHTLTQIGHLAERGHRTIAFALPAEPDLDGLAALRQRFAEESGRRLGVDGMSTIRLSADPEEAWDALALLRRETQVTAIAAFDDEVAFRTLAALADLGLSAPHDLAVIGFDDSRFAAAWRPALTSVRIDGGMFGRRTARTLLGYAPEDSDGIAATVMARDTT